MQASGSMAGEGLTELKSCGCSMMKPTAGAAPDCLLLTAVNVSCCRGNLFRVHQAVGLLSGPRQVGDLDGHGFAVVRRLEPFSGGSVRAAALLDDHQHGAVIVGGDLGRLTVQLHAALAA